MSEERHNSDSSGSSEPGLLEAFLDPRVLDPLSEVTRRERKALLIASLIALAISFGGLVPKEIQALGVKLSPPERNSILLLIALSIIYLLVGFSIYALADWRRRSAAIVLGRRRIPSDLHTKAAAGEQRLNTMIEANDFDLDNFLNDPEIRNYHLVSEDLALVRRVQFTGTFRVLFDLVVPILVGLAALGYSLYSARALPFARIVGVIVAVLLTLFIVVSLWRQRKRIALFMKRQRDQWYNRRLNIGMKRLEALGPASPRRAKLEKRFEKLLRKRLRLMGITEQTDGDIHTSSNQGGGNNLNVSESN